MNDKNQFHISSDNVAIPEIHNKRYEDAQKLMDYFQSGVLDKTDKNNFVFAVQTTFNLSQWHKITNFLDGLFTKSQINDESFGWYAKKNALCPSKERCVNSPMVIQSMIMRNGSRFLWGKGIAVAKWVSAPHLRCREACLLVPFSSTCLHPLEELIIPKAKEGST